MNRIALHFLIIIFCFPSFACSQDSEISDYPPEGKASFYAKKFQGRKTANGELFSNYDYTAAHRSLPFNTYLNVVNKSNNYNIIVRVNDRGPYAKNRVIDLSEAAARRIGGYQHGLVPVRLEILDLVQDTPELEKIYNATPFVDCLGNEAALSDISLSLWSTYDLVHAVYVANDLYLKESVNQVLIGNKLLYGKKKYYIIITGIEGKAAATKAKDEFERKGFMKVAFFESTK